MPAPLRPALAGLKAYSAEPDLGEAALDANENPLPPPPAWLERAAELAGRLRWQRYPDPGAGALRSRLAALHGLPPGSLLFGNGSDELIALLLAAFGGGRALCLLPSPTFSMYRLCALGQGWEVAEEELDGDWDLSPAFVAAARRLQPRLIFLASPNNPTGRAFAPGLVDKLRGLPGCSLVLDEAYAEFGGRSLLREAASEEGLIVLRTFSKAWGLAGLRLGWLCARPELVAELEKLRLPYNIDAFAQALGAEAVALAPQFLGRLPGLLELRGRLRAALEALPGAQVWPSDANFHLLRHPAAPALHAHLLKAGLRARRFEGGRLDKCLRLSAGDSEQTERLEAALAAFRA